MFTSFMQCLSVSFQWPGSANMLKSPAGRRSLKINAAKRPFHRDDWRSHRPSAKLPPCSARGWGLLSEERLTNQPAKRVETIICVDFVCIRIIANLSCMERGYPLSVGVLYFSQPGGFVHEVSTHQIPCSFRFQSSRNCWVFLQVGWHSNEETSHLASALQLSRPAHLVRYFCLYPGYARFDVVVTTLLLCYMTLSLSMKEWMVMISVPYNNIRPVTVRYLSIPHCHQVAFNIAAKTRKAWPVSGSVQLRSQTTSKCPKGSVSGTWSCRRSAKMTQFKLGGKQNLLSQARIWPQNLLGKDVFLNKIGKYPLVMWRDLPWSRLDESFQCRCKEDSFANPSLPKVVIEGLQWHLHSHPWLLDGFISPLQVALLCYLHTWLIAQKRLETTACNQEDLYIPDSARIREFICKKLWPT